MAATNWQSSILRKVFCRSYLHEFRARARQVPDCGSAQCWKAISPEGRVEAHAPAAVVHVLAQQLDGRLGAVRLQLQAGKVANAHE